jgi:hypothetical protein
MSFGSHFSALLRTRHGQNSGFSWAWHGRSIDPSFGGPAHASPDQARWISSHLDLESGRIDCAMKEVMSRMLSTASYLLTDIHGCAWDACGLDLLAFLCIGPHRRTFNVVPLSISVPTRFPPFYIQNRKLSTFLPTPVMKQSV